MAISVDCTAWSDAWRVMQIIPVVRGVFAAEHVRLSHSLNDGQLKLQVQSSIHLELHVPLTVVNGTADDTFSLCVPREPLHAFTTATVARQHGLLLFAWTRDTLTVKDRRRILRLPIIASRLAGRFVRTEMPTQNGKLFVHSTAILAVAIRASKFTGKNAAEPEKTQVLIDSCGAFAHHAVAGFWEKSARSLVASPIAIPEKLLYFAQAVGNVARLVVGHDAVCCILPNGVATHPVSAVATRAFPLVRIKKMFSDFQCKHTVAIEAASLVHAAERFKIYLGGAVAEEDRFITIIAFLRDRLRGELRGSVGQAVFHESLLVKGVVGFNLGKSVAYDLYFPLFMPIVDYAKQVSAKRVLFGLHRDGKHYCVRVKKARFIIAAKVG